MHNQSFIGFENFEKACVGGLVARTTEAARAIGLSPKQVAGKLTVALVAELTKLIPGRGSTDVDARQSFDTDASMKRAQAIIAAYAKRGTGKERILIKLAATWEGIRAAEVLEGEEIDCNPKLIWAAKLLTVGEVAHLSCLKSQPLSFLSIAALNSRCSLYEWLVFPLRCSADDHAPATTLMLCGRAGRDWIHSMGSFETFAAIRANVRNAFSIVRLRQANTETRCWTCHTFHSDTGDLGEPNALCP